MKRNIYSYSKLWMIFFVLMGAACTNQVEDAIPVSSQPIGFSVQSDWTEIPNTRLKDDNGTMTFTGGDQIQIFGFHKSSPDGVEKVQKFMYDVKNPNNGQIVIYDGNSSWNYTPKRFWPKEGKLDFFASYPYNSVHYMGVNQRMTYENPLTQDLLYGLATDRDCASASKDTVRIWMVHALAKVKISFDSSLGDIRKVKVSAYKAGYFDYTYGGVPNWIVDETTTQEATFSPDKGQTKIDQVTVFVLPHKIKGLILTLSNGTEIDASDKIQSYLFDAGKPYDLTIHRAQKNTNSCSIAMSVRCVSE